LALRERALAHLDAAPALERVIVVVLFARARVDDLNVHAFEALARCVNVVLELGHVHAAPGQLVDLLFLLGAELVADGHGVGGC
jgi:hypothetical protein